MQKLAILTLPVVAPAAIDAYVPLNIDGTVTADAGFPLGFTQYQAIAGEAVAVTVIGTAIAIAGAAITEGDALKVAGGKVVPGAAVANVVARALQAGVEGEKIEILLLPRAV
ncbi:MAG: hypothetical protein LBI35_01245 [Burkholderiales bacterium]|jgi:hypothetical protein|nr:hypothetical protein [Burkholderiales bacterium]